jgi:hypothetical protein
MRYTLLTGLIMVMLACGNGCMTQTVTTTGAGTAGRKPLSTQTYWIWQPEFWQHKQ